MAIVVAVMATLLMSVLGSALVLTTSTEALIAANFRSAHEGAYAADAAIERVKDDLVSSANWDLLLDGSTRSAFVDGPPTGVRTLADGARIDLASVVNLMNCGKATLCSASNLTAVTTRRPWGLNNPFWRLIAYGQLAALLPAGVIESPYYVTVMVADDPSENDNDPLHDGHSETNPGTGVLAVRADAFGPRGTRQAVEATIARSAAPDGITLTLRILSWRLIR
jgi:hypothetical protein